MIRWLCVFASNLASALMCAPSSCTREALLAVDVDVMSHDLPSGSRCKRSGSGQSNSVRPT